MDLGYLKDLPYGKLWALYRAVMWELFIRQWWVLLILIVVGILLFKYFND